MKLFVMDGKDYTNNIKVPTYTVNQIPNYINWTDATYHNHRYLARKTVSGTFTIWFDIPEDYFEFLDTVRNNTNTLGYIPNVEVYCNNINNVVVADIFLDMNPANDLPYYGAKPHDGYQVTIQER